MTITLLLNAEEYIDSIPYLEHLLKHEEVTYEKLKIALIKNDKERFIIASLLLKIKKKQLKVKPGLLKDLKERMRLLNGLNQNILNMMKYKKKSHSI